MLMFSSLTWAHGASELDKAPEGEARDESGRPHLRLRVKALLITHPSALLLPVALLLLILHLFLHLLVDREKHKLALISTGQRCKDNLCL